MKLSFLETLFDLLVKQLNQCIALSVPFGGEHGGGVVCALMAPTQQIATTKRYMMIESVRIWDH
jgi:hypothetical protein